MTTVDPAILAAFVIDSPEALAVFADMLADAGDPREEAARWLIAKKKWPTGFLSEDGCWWFNPRSSDGEQDDLMWKKDNTFDDFYDVGAVGAALRFALAEYLSDSSARSVSATVAAWPDCRNSNENRPGASQRIPEPTTQRVCPTDDIL